MIEMKRIITIILLILSIKSYSQQGTLTPKKDINKTTSIVSDKNVSINKKTNKKSNASNKKSNPLPSVDIFEIIITPIEDYNHIQYLYTKNGIEIQEILDDTFIIGINLQKNIQYKLKVENIGTDFTKFKLIQQIEPIPDVMISPKNPSNEIHNIPVFFYNCKSEEQKKATPNEIIYTDYTLDSNGNISIRPVDVTKPFYTFTGKIFGFTFLEDHKYTLEVLPKDNDYILIEILCDQKLNYVTNPAKKIYPNNTIDTITKSKNGVINNSKINIQQENNENKIIKPLVKIKSIDDAVWYLRYLFQKDELTPINDINDTSYTITFKSWKKASYIKTPCGDFEANCIVDDLGLFNFENLNGFLNRCDLTNKLFLEQLKIVNKYELVDNKLKLSINKPEFAQPKILIVFEGYPKQ